MAALFYHPEAYTVSGPKLMGRNAAGESFLKGYLRYGQRSDHLWTQVQHPDHAEEFAKTAQSYGRSEPVRFIDKNSLSALAEPGLVFYPGPGIGEYAFERSAFGHASWSICGITHTTSSAGAMDAIVNLLAAPVQPWDAVICTSTAVKANVLKILQAQVDYLQSRFGITKVTLPQLPVVPLGIHTDEFHFSIEEKRSSRQQLGISVDEQVVLFVGRLSFHAKAHPLAMYQALEKAACTTQKNICLVECGWFANEFIENAYHEAARFACPSVRVITLDGRQAEQRKLAWSSADIFCSLSDNIQETFGIVPIEAMAAGLPVVVSDWDGYKDTVRDAVDGFRIPTWMPPKGLGGDIAYRHALGIDTYDMYCGHTCSLIAVDIDKAAQAFERLVISPELRQQMGEEGRKRARELYDWRVIIPQYEELWANLSEIRHAEGAKMTAAAHSWPARLDPFGSFDAYPSHIISLNTQFSLVPPTPSDAKIFTQRLSQLAMVNFAKLVIPKPDEIHAIIDTFSDQTKTAEQLIQNISVDRKAFVFRSFGWMMKIGLIKVV